MLSCVSIYFTFQANNHTSINLFTSDSITQGASFEYIKIHEKHRYKWHAELKKQRGQSKAGKYIELVRKRKYLR